MQWTVGYLNVGDVQASDGIATQLATNVIPSGAPNQELDRNLKVWASPNAITDTNFQFYPRDKMPNSWDNSTYSWQDNRMQLTPTSYKILYSNPTLNSKGYVDRMDYGAKTDARTQQAVLGLEGSDELSMKPATVIPLWKPDNDGLRKKRMHYITMGSTDKGFAAMQENYVDPPNNGPSTMKA